RKSAFRLPLSERRHHRDHVARLGLFGGSTEELARESGTRAATENVKVRMNASVTGCRRPFLTSQLPVSRWHEQIGERWRRHPRPAWSAMPIGSRCAALPLCVRI